MRRGYVAHFFRGSSSDPIEGLVVGAIVLPGVLAILTTSGLLAFGSVGQLGAAVVATIGALSWVSIQRGRVRRRYRAALDQQVGVQYASGRETVLLTITQGSGSFATASDGAPIDTPPLYLLRHAKDVSTVIVMAASADLAKVEISHFKRTLQAEGICTSATWESLIWGAR